ncbi:MAG: hypothetical protein K8U57_21615 [Planctomycetes bacterium]|nr:hypothetical protein [Planctomycetota bacterium]
MGFAEEFATVDLLLKSETETRGIDAFALTLIKSEKQLRRLVTHLIYQFPAFNGTHILLLRDALAKNRQVYADGFRIGFNALYRKSIRQLIGLEHDGLLKRLDEATKYRNKIFHGQLTHDSLSRQELLDYVRDMRRWCELLAKGATEEFHYDGCGDSFRKSMVTNLGEGLLIKMTSIADYKKFIAAHLERPKKR